MQCAVGANVGTDESIIDKSLIVRILRKWSFPSGTTFKNRAVAIIIVAAFLFDLSSPKIALQHISNENGSNRE